MSVAGVLHQDLLGRWQSGGGRLGTWRRRPESLRGFRAAALASVVVPFVLSLFAGSLSLADTVGLAFAMAASTFCPLLVLGIWWRGLTRTGALAGLVVGGALASAAVVITMVGGTRTGWAGALLAQPAAWTVPLAFLTMIVVSLATPHAVPPHVARTMVRLHAPEERGRRPLVALIEPLVAPRRTAGRRNASSQRPPGRRRFPARPGESTVTAVTTR